MREAVIVSAVRTPMAKFKGDFAAIPIVELGAIAMKACVEKVGVDPALIDEVVYGNLGGADVGDPARQCLMQAGFPDTVPGITVDRQCGSSLTGVGFAAAMIQTGMADVTMGGGVESYSQMRMLFKNPQMAFPSRLEQVFYHTSTTERGGRIDMIPTAENLAKQYKLTREEVDEFAYNSQMKAVKAWENGWFDEQIVPVTVQDRKKGEYVVKMDASVRADTTMEGLAKLRPVMKDGVSTAGNSSPQNDGSTAVLLMSREKANELGLDILGVVKEFTSAGVDPVIMGIGPVASTQKLYKRFGYKNEDFDLFELNEAFAAQSIPCIRELGWDINKVNVEGGAIAIGHPLAASGGMLIGRMVYALRRRGLKRGLVSFCVGGGQGVTMVIENDQVK